jgi:hypothetical protein
LIDGHVFSLVIDSLTPKCSKAKKTIPFPSVVDKPLRMDWKEFVWIRFVPGDDNIPPELDGGDRPLGGRSVGTLDWAKAVQGIHRRHERVVWTGKEHCSRASALGQSVDSSWMVDPQHSTLARPRSKRLESH